MNLKRLPQKALAKFRSRALNRIKGRIKQDPFNGELHFELSQLAYRQGRLFLAWSEVKTAEFLGKQDRETAAFKKQLEDMLPALTDLDHNVYFRLRSIADEVRARVSTFQKNEYSILDVGGGQGMLAAFLPEADYCLAEPNVIGIDGKHLPFEEGAFDMVVSCHVLEHIPIPDRERFLDQLVEKSKFGVILLNPIHIEETLPKERMELIVDVTQFLWAKEHLACTLPKTEFITQYAEKRGLEFNYSPNGTLSTSLAYVFLDYFATLGNRKKDLEKINRFFNTNYINLLTSEEHPNAGLFFLGKG